jgi:malonate decarboxylase beta subunit
MSKGSSAITLRNSYIELIARERARRLLDDDTFHELLGPFDRVSSIWLSQQGIVPQSDDGVVVAQGKIEGQESVIIAIEGKFQGGSIGEVSGSKILCALQLTRKDYERGVPRIPVLLLETGGVRLQEANLGLELISEIHAEILALRTLIPVIGVIAGAIGCFGGMSIAAALCSYILITPQGRYGLNGPEVIEQEAGYDEIDASDRQMVWSLIGGSQRANSAVADSLLVDDMEVVRQGIVACMQKGLPMHHRTDLVSRFLSLLENPEVQNMSSPEEFGELLRLARKYEQPC